MSFSYSGGVITMTGTEADLSGLVGLTGVTTTTIDPDTGTNGWKQVIYVIDASTRIVINGTVSHDPDVEMLVLEREANSAISTPPLLIGGTGIYNYGVQRTGNGNTIYSSGTGINLPNKGVNFYGYFGMVIATNGTFNWNGGIIRSGSTFLIDESANLTVNAGVFLNPADADTQLRINATSAVGSEDININNIELTGFTRPPKFFTRWSFGVATFVLKNSYIQQFNYNYPEQEYLDLDNSQNIADRDFEFLNDVLARGANIVFRNPRQKVVGRASKTRTGYTRTIRDVSVTPTDLNGAGVSFSYYGQDFDSGNRTVGGNDGGTDEDGQPVDQDDTDTKTYSGLNQTGSMDETILVHVMLKTSTTTSTVIEDARHQGDTIPIRFIGYNESITEWNSTLYGNGTLTENLPMTPDLSITESTKATVDAYTELETPEKFYDRAKAELYNAYAGETSTTVSRNANIIDLGTQNIVIDASATPAFDLTGSTVTIHADTYTGGFETSGTIDQTNGAILSDLDLSGGATWNAIQSTWTGSAGATETIDVANGGTYDATGFTFDASTTLNNSSGGAITVNISQGQQQPTTTGDTVNFVELPNTITFNGLTSSNVFILDDDGTTVRDYQTAQTGSYAFNIPLGSSGVWTYVVNREGYNPLVGTFESSDFTTTVNVNLSQKLQPDGSAMYLASSSTFLNIDIDLVTPQLSLDISDGQVTVQQCFGEVEDALMTSDGMQWLAQGGGEVSIALLATGSFLFMENDVRLRRESAGDVNATVNGFAQSTDGTVVDGANGSVAFFTVSDADQIASHQGKVWVDTGSAFTGTVFPVGTSLRPVNNLSDAVLIANSLGLVEMVISSNLTINTDIENFRVIDVKGVHTLTFGTGSVEGSSFDGFEVTGAQNGKANFINCNLTSVTGADGNYQQCKLDAGGIVLASGATEVDFLYCMSHVAGTGKPELDMTGTTGCQLNVRAYSGGLKVTNCTDAGNNISVDMISGSPEFDATDTAGTAIVRGVGVAVVDNSGASFNLVSTGFNPNPSNLDVAVSTRSDFDESVDEVTTDSASRTASQADVSALATQASVDGLNDLSTADIDARLSAYGLPTLTQMTSAFTEIKGAGWTVADTLEAIRDAITSGNVSPADIWTYATREVTGGTIDTNNDMVSEPDNAGIASALAQATLARKHLTNRDKIDETANTLTRYDDDGTTALAVFDLKDADGVASTDEIFEKDPQ